MTGRRMGYLMGWTALAAVMAPAMAAGQGLASRVAAMDEGTVRMEYAARPGVEICDDGIRMDGDNYIWHTRRGDDEPSNCRPGPVEVELEVQSGRVRDVEIVRRLRDRTEGAVDAGAFSGREAADFFLDVARGGPGNPGEEDAIFAAVLADVQELWRELLVLARDRGVDGDVRSSSLFWVGQEAATAVTEGLADFALDEDEDQDVRDAAVFALSQRPADEGVPILMEVARTAKNAETRRSAMFWLAESEDERVFAFFEEILVGRGGG